MGRTGRAGAIYPPSSRARTFRAIYSGNRWRGTETRSGPGSTLASTRRLREALPGLVGDRSLLDIGCGASWWMPDLPRYTGIDIVPEAVAAVSERFPHRHYLVGDAVTDEWPVADMVLMRDVLAHLPVGDVLTLLAKARGRRLLATTFDGADNAVDTRPGGYHEYDLTIAPYDLGPPEWSIIDGWWEDELVYPTKRMAMWSMS